MLHLDGGGGHREAQVFVSCEAGHAHRLVLYIPRCYSLILVQVKGAWDALNLGVAPLVTVASLGLALVLSSTSTSSSTTTTSTLPAVAPVAPALGSSPCGRAGVLALVLAGGGLGMLGYQHRCSCEGVWVVFAHVFHQVRLLKAGRRGEQERAKTREEQESVSEAVFNAHITTEPNCSANTKAP